MLKPIWAVAATNHTLGDKDKALKDYLVLLDDMTKVPNMHVNTTVVHSCEGKLYFEHSQVDRSIQSFRHELQGADVSFNQQLKSSTMLLYKKLLRNKFLL